MRANEQGHRRYHGGEHIPQFPGATGADGCSAPVAVRGALGRGPDPGAAGLRRRLLRLILLSALQVDNAIFFSAAITVAAFVPLFTMQGVEGQIFRPMAQTYGYALAGALFATFTVTPALSSVLLPRQVRELETILVRVLRFIYEPLLR
jgi:heavy metal efflux system protein